MNIEIGSRKIGDGCPCFITFEAGPTHSGLASAKRLAKYAAEAGGDAIKFQIFDPDELVADKTQTYEYDVLVDKETGETETVSEPLHDIFVRRSMKDEEWIELKQYCDELGLAFFATVGDENGLALLEKLKCDSIKVASADVNHLPFIRLAARTGACIQLDTGNASIGEIEKAVDVIRSEGNENIVIHNCPTGYPAHLESINLNMLPSLKELFDTPVAYSDHSPGAEMDIAAVALGANLVEKTITEDRCTRSVEHIMSLEPQDMQAFVQTIRDVETAMGASRRVLSEEAVEKRKAIRRSVFLSDGVKRGMRLSEAKISFKRPGYGLAPDEYETLLDKEFRSDMKLGDMVSREDLI